MTRKRVSWLRRQNDSKIMASGILPRCDHKFTVWQFYLIWFCSRPYQVREAWNCLSQRYFIQTPFVIHSLVHVVHVSWTFNSSTGSGWKPVPTEARESDLHDISARTEQLATQLMNWCVWQTLAIGVNLPAYLVVVKSSHICQIEVVLLTWLVQLKSTRALA